MESSFIPDLWREWFVEEYKHMVKGEPYPWEDILMEKSVKCFHLDDITWCVPSKCGEIYPESTRKYWGHIVTNKASRSDSKFAYLFDPNGERVNCITHATFKILTFKMKHEYIKTVHQADVDEFTDQIPYLSKFQARFLIKCLVKNSPHLANYRSEYTVFKNPRFIIIDMGD